MTIKHKLYKLNLFHIRVFAIVLEDLNIETYTFS